MTTLDLFSDVNQVADMQNMTELEKKHLPVILAPQTVQAGERFQVIIEVGKLHPHPNEHTHFIEFIELYADRLYLARADLTAVTSWPEVTFNVSLPAGARELRAYERCNLHGVWESAKPITVTE